MRAASLAGLWPFPAEDLATRGTLAVVVTVDRVLTPEAAPAYDIQVEADAGFIAAGVVVHNSDICRPCDGTVLSADSEWFQSHYPPLHPNCRCIAVTLTEAQAEREGISRSGPSVEPVDGFGRAPSGAGGADWAPDPKDYPDEFAAELEDKEAEGGG